jgi:hypothetical protein
MKTAARKRFAATYFCRHTHWHSLPDGPGYEREKRKFQTAASLNLCPDCARKNNERAAAGSYADRW